MDTSIGSDMLLEGKMRTRKAEVGEGAADGGLQPEPQRLEVFTNILSPTTCAKSDMLLVIGV